MIKLIYEGANPPTINPEKYIWINGNETKVWNGVDWENIKVDSQEKIADSLLPDTIVRKLELQSLIDDLGIHSGADGAPGADGVGIHSTTYWFKLTETDSVTEPNINTNPESEGWTTDVQNLMVSYEYPYLWCFCRIIYTNSSIFQTEVYIVSKYNAEVDAAIEELRREIEEEISEDITSVENRLSDVEGNYAVQNISSDDALVEILTGYQDPEQTSFADIIADAAKGTINENVGAAMDDTTTSVGQKMDAINGELTAHATALDDGEGGIIDVRQSMNALEGEMTSSVAKATYCWVKNDDNPNPQDPAIKPYNGELIMSGYTKKVITNELSVIKQSSDEILLAVGDGTDNRAALDIIGGAYDGSSKINLTADEVNINAGALNTGLISADRIDVSNIVAQSLVSQSDTGFTTKIEPGVFQFLYNNSVVAEFFINNAGYVTLRVLGANNNWCDLSALGAITHTSSIVEVSEKFTSLSIYKFNSSSNSAINSYFNGGIITQPIKIPSSPTTYYKYSVGYKNDDGEISYAEPLSNPVIYWSGAEGEAIKTNYDGKIYTNNTSVDNPVSFDTVYPKYHLTSISSSLIYYAPYYYGIIYPSSGGNNKGSFIGNPLYFKTSSNSLAGATVTPITKAEYDDAVNRQ